MPYRGEPRLETILKNRLNKGLFDSAFKNHAFITLNLILFSLNPKSNHKSQLHISLLVHIPKHSIFRLCEKTESKEQSLQRNIQHTLKSVAKYFSIIPPPKKQKMCYRYDSTSQVIFQSDIT